MKQFIVIRASSEGYLTTERGNDRVVLNSFVDRFILTNNHQKLKEFLENAEVGEDIKIHFGMYNWHAVVVRVA